MKSQFQRIMTNIGLFAMAAVLFSSCAKEVSTATGWNYNDEKNGGFEKSPYVEQETGPGLILIEGGTFTMGRTEEDVNYDWNNQPRRVTVASFYLDETEITNLHWNEYLYWLDRVYGTNYPEIYRKALPDTLVWRSKMAYNEPYVEYYLRHPAYQDYPVVGVNWLQANDYCAWRTDRVNEIILIREGLLEHFPQQYDSDHFSTDAFLAGQYNSGKLIEGLQSLNPDEEFRNVTMNDGILLPRYRLPTEAEWEFAAYGLIGNTFQELISEKKIYPWNGHYVRNDDPNSKLYGAMMANFVRGRGDYMGVAGTLNDNADITAPVYSYPPNDYGLYNMAGNVSEWVLDVYRPLTSEVEDEFRPFRGNVFKTKMKNSEGHLVDKYEEVAYDIDGVNKYLLDFQKVTEKKLNTDEVNLLEEAINLSSEAKTANDERKYDDANDKVQAIVDMIKANDLDISGKLISGISDYVDGEPGTMRWREVTVEENIDRRNYRQADYIGYMDGDKASSIYYAEEEVEGNLMYDWGNVTLVSDRSRVYKGGSWRDRSYYLVPAARRFLDERHSEASIGFRCAMDRIGSPKGINADY